MTPFGKPVVPDEKGRRHTSMRGSMVGRLIRDWPLCCVSICETDEWDDGMESEKTVNLKQNTIFYP